MGGELRLLQAPALEVRAHLGLARPAVVQHERRVHLGPPARLAGVHDRERVAEIELDAGLLRHRGDRRPGVALE
jgi:hypothetical protein